VGALATAILVVNNVRDRATDAECGKRTLAVRFGRLGALVEYCALLGLAYAVPVLLFVTGARGILVLLPLLTAPVAASLTHGLIHAGDGPSHNRLLAGTAKLLLLHGLLFAAGLAL
jgi:1,4-dihydroxy-2-naphthoate octaprenyltransferase